MKPQLSEKQYQNFVDSPFERHKLFLNADLGEGGTADEAIMAYIHAASIACGGHAGNTKLMQTSVRAAYSNQLIIGAHPAYQDKKNFGRKSLLGIESQTSIIHSTLEQILALKEICKDEGVTLRYIKPHGALYHDLGNDRDFAYDFSLAIKENFPSLAVMGFSGSIFVKQAELLAIETWPEGFIDRQYHSSGILVPRNSSDIEAVLDSEAAMKQALSLREGWVLDEAGCKMSIQCKTLCVHGDTPDALKIARSVAEAFI